MKEEIKEVVNSVVEAAGKMDKGMVDTIMTKLEAMASGLGTTAEYLWGITVKQAMVIAVIDSILSLLFLGIITSFVMFVVAAVKRGWYDSSEEGAVITTIFGGIISIVLMMVFLCDLMPEAIACIINPEYWAFEQICNKIK